MLLWLQGRTVRGTPRVAIVLTSPPSLRTHLQSLVTTDYWWVVQSQEWLTNIKILLTISIHHHTTRLWELLTWQPKGKCFDFFCQILPTNFFRKKDGDQTWEFRITIRFWETDHSLLPLTNIDTYFSLGATLTSFPGPSSTRPPERLGVREDPRYEVSFPVLLYIQEISFCIIFFKSFVIYKSVINQESFFRLRAIYFGIFILIWFNILWTNKALFTI